MHTICFPVRRVFKLGGLSRRSINLTIGVKRFPLAPMPLCSPTSTQSGVGAWGIGWMSYIVGIYQVRPSQFALLKVIQSQTRATFQWPRKPRTSTCEHLPAGRLVELSRSPIYRMLMSCGHCALSKKNQPVRVLVLEYKVNDPIDWLRGTALTNQKLTFSPMI